MIIRKPGQKGRRGASVVEMAFVCILLFMFLFGIFEYCRLLFMMHVTHNAARDTVRFAVVHTSGGTMPTDPATISRDDLINLVRTGQIGAQVYGTGLCGMEGNIEALNVEVFLVDPAGLAQNPPVIQELAGSQWNDASFGQKIAIRITGNYRPITPALLFMSSSIPFQVTVMATSEAN